MFDLTNEGTLTTNADIDMISAQYIQASNDGSMLFVGDTSNVYGIDLSSGKVTAYYSGFVSPISVLKVSNDSNYLAVTTRSAQWVTLWPARVVNPSSLSSPEQSKSDKQKGKKRKRNGDTATSIDSTEAVRHYTTEIASFAIPESLAHIDLISQQVTDEKCDVQVAATALNGLVYLFKATVPSITHSQPEKDEIIRSTHPITTILDPTIERSLKVDKAKENTMAIKKTKAKSKNTFSRGKFEDHQITSQGSPCDCRFTDQHHVIIARYSPIKPDFITLDLSDKSSSNGWKKLIHLEPLKILDSRINQMTSKHGQAHVLTDRAKTTKLTTPITTGITVPEPTVDSMTDSETINSSHNAKRKRLLDHTQSLNQSLFVRLQESATGLTPRGHGDDPLAIMSHGADQLPRIDPSQRPTATDHEGLRKHALSGTLVSIFVQALESKDDSLLEQCLSMGYTPGEKDMKRMSLTVSQLPVKYVIPFIQHLSRRLLSNTTRAAELYPWIREVLRSHIAYLLSNPSIHEHLAPLYHLSEQRLQNNSKIIQLKGRLELIISQITRGSSLGGGAGAASTKLSKSSFPSQLYQDSDSKKGVSGPRLNTVPGYGNDGDDNDDDDGDDDMMDDDAFDLLNASQFGEGEFGEGELDHQLLDLLYGGEGETDFLSMFGGEGDFEYDEDEDDEDEDDFADSDDNSNNFDLDSDDI